MFGHPPTYDHVRIFGFLCYAHKGTHSRDKFDERAVQCVFLGYPYNQKGWRIYDLERKEFFVTRDVVFNEANFPYAVVSPSRMSPSMDQHKFSSQFLDDDAALVSKNVPVPTGSSYLPPRILDMGSNSNSSVSVSAPSPGPIVSVTGDDLPISQPSSAVSDNSTLSQEQAEVTLGRGHREKKKSVLLQPYVTYTTCSLEDPSHSSPSSLQSTLDPPGTEYPLANYVSCERFHRTFEFFLPKS